jgi:hypothetical protein
LVGSDFAVGRHAGKSPVWQLGRSKRWSVELPCIDLGGCLAQPLCNAEIDLRQTLVSSTL